MYMLQIIFYANPKTQHEWNIPLGMDLVNGSANIR